MARNFGIIRGGGTSTNADSAARATATAAKTAIDAISPASGDVIEAGTIAILVGQIWRNPTAASIKVPATISETTLATAGLTKEDGAQQVDEVVYSASSDLTGKAPDGAKLGVRIDTGAQFTVGDDGNWVKQVAPAVSLMTGATAAAAGTGGTVPAPAAGMASRGLRADGTWGECLSRARVIAEGVVFAQSELAYVVRGATINGTPRTWRVYYRCNVPAGRTVGPMGTAAEINAELPNWIYGHQEWIGPFSTPRTWSVGEMMLQNGGLYRCIAQHTATTGNGWNATEQANWEYVMGANDALAVTLGAFTGSTIPDGQTIPQALQSLETALEAMGVPTLRLASGGTPAANGIYVQAVGDTHIAPTLTAGQRTTVINLQAGGNTIETTYLHDGVAQVTSIVGTATPNEVVASTTALSGTAPAGARFGFNSATNTLYMVVGGNWQAVPALSPSDVRFAASAPDAGNTTQTVWVDVSAARWPVYRRALASDAWPTEPTGHVFEVAVANGTAQEIIDRVDEARAWTPLVLSDALRANDTARFKHYSSGELDFNALHTGANTRAIRMFSFTGSVELKNPPQEGAALGVTGHGYYIGDTDNGQQFVYFLRDANGRETEYYRERGGGTWTKWFAVSSDSWQGSSNGMQINSGMHVTIADGHDVHFLASDRARAVRLIPDSDWANVGEITPGNGWTFDGDFPTSGRQEVVLVPAAVENVWNVSAVIAGITKPPFIKRTTNTTGSAPTEVEYPDPAEGDVVIVQLGNSTVEVWSHDGTDWTVGSAIVANPSIIPTVQAGLGAAVKMDDYGRPSDFHLNSANGGVTWAVGGAPDGVWHYVTNNGTVDATVTFSGHAGVFLRDGRANSSLGATLTTKAGEKYLIHVTKNGNDRFVNAARLSAATGAEARTITGSATATGYDNVPVPVSITLTAGKALDTVTATNGALVSNINSLLGTCLVTAKGQNTVLSHTTKDAVAYNGLQRVGDKDFGSVQLTTTATDYTLDVTLQEGDLLEITENYNNNTTEDHVLWVRVAAGRQAIVFQYPADGNGVKVLFPSTLSNKVKLSTKSNTNHYLRKIRVWRDAANGFVVPTGTEVRTACDVTCNAGAVNVNGGPSTRAYAGTSMRVLIALPTGQRLDTVTASNGGVVAIADLFTGAIELAVPQGTTGAIALTATFTPIVPKVARSIVTADGGVTVPCGTIEVRLPASGNRSIQMRSVSGTLTCRAATVWADGGNTANVLTSLTTAWTYANSTWNFTTAGQWQDVLFIDQTNNRTYRIKMTIGASYNTNQFWIEEMVE